MNAQDKATKFEAGKVYFARSFCDYDTIIKIKIVKITPKMVKYIELDMWGDEAVKSRKIVQHENRQTFSAGAGFVVSSSSLLETEECPKEIEPVADVAAEVVLDIQEPEAGLALDQEMTIGNPDYSLLEANGVWGGEFRGQWKYKLWHKNPSFCKSADKGLALGHAIAAYNEIPIADRVGTKEEAYNKINKARYDRLDAVWGLSSMEELSGMMQDCKELSSSLFNSALNGMDARPFSAAMNRSVRYRLSVGYVGETIADLAFYIEERAKIEAMAE